jgi:hypothetical protein
MHPPFFSLEFHMRFFPALIRARMMPENKGGTVFVPANYLRAGIAMLCFIILFVIGKTSFAAMPVLSWIASITGIVGIVAVTIYSIYTQRGISPSYDTFLFGMFSLCLALGMTIGIFITATEHFPLLFRILGGLSGLFAGYFVGIWAGLYMQKLGFIAYMLEALAIPAIIGMVIVDLLLFFAS